MLKEMNLEILDKPEEFMSARWSLGKEDVQFLLEMLRDDPKLALQRVYGYGFLRGQVSAIDCVDRFVQALSMKPLPDVERALEGWEE